MNIYIHIYMNNMHVYNIHLTYYFLSSPSRVSLFSLWIKSLVSQPILSWLRFPQGHICLYWTFPLLDLVISFQVFLNQHSPAIAVPKITSFYPFSLKGYHKCQTITVHSSDMVCETSLETPIHSLFCFQWKFWLYIILITEKSYSQLT